MSNKQCQKQTNKKILTSKCANKYFHFICWTVIFVLVCSFNMTKREREAFQKETKFFCKWKNNLDVFVWPTIAIPSSILGQHLRKSICSSQVIKWVMRHSWPQWTNKLSSLINVFRQGTHGHPVTQHIVQCRWNIVRCFINQCFTNVRIQHDQHYLLS